MRSGAKWESFVFSTRFCWKPKSALKNKVYFLKKNICLTSGQDGGIGRYALFPCTSKRRTTTNLKTKNNQNCQEIELYGSPTTKELKKKHSPRLCHKAAARVAPPW